MIYGYCRISTNTQSLERQERNIKNVFPSAVLVKEVYTGNTTDRPEWSKLLRSICEGDSIIFDSVSRLSRSAEEGYMMYQDLFKRGIDLFFLQETWCNTSVIKEAISLAVGLQNERTNKDEVMSEVFKFVEKMGLLMIERNIKSAFEQAEKEVSDLKQRTCEGMETAKLNGKQIGQKKGNQLSTVKEPIIKETIQRYSKDFNGTLADSQVMALIVEEIRKHNQKNPKHRVKESVAKGTYYKHKREMSQEGRQLCLEI